SVVAGSGATRLEQLAVTLDVTGTIEGHAADGGPGRPGHASGVTVHGGGVAIAGTKTQRARVTGGAALATSAGLRLCDDPSLGELPCGAIRA
ncbi:hypothetical protein RSW36_26670, partial [Escherichia coli]|uniref:hypothetical protein n=1 Tax=Escherichia coli TaxID=562 RepID=UPI0028E0733B